MAVIGGSQVKVLWFDGDAGRTVLFAVNGVTSADTLDVGPSGAMPEFRALKQAIMIGSTVIGSATASVSGTVITMPAGLANDSAYVLAFGDAL